MIYDDRVTAADVSAWIINSDNPEKPGFGLATLSKKYTYATLWVFRLDNQVGPWLYRRLRLHGKRSSIEQSWDKRASAIIDDMAALAMHDVRAERGMSEKKRCAFLGIDKENTWYRVYKKPYDDIYGVLRSWAAIGQRTVYLRCRNG